MTVTLVVTCAVGVLIVCTTESLIPSIGRSQGSAARIAEMTFGSLVGQRVRVDGEVVIFKN